LRRVLAPSSADEVRSGRFASVRSEDYESFGAAPRWDGEAVPRNGGLRWRMRRWRQGWGW
jgi:hypothetical protein